jgi:hypothetical protein
LWEYKSYATIIWVFIVEFLNSLQQPLGDNLWPTELIIQNSKGNVTTYWVSKI